MKYVTFLVDAAQNGPESVAAVLEVVDDRSRRVASEFLLPDQAVQVPLPKSGRYSARVTFVSGHTEVRTLDFNARTRTSMTVIIKQPGPHSDGERTCDGWAAGWRYSRIGGARPLEAGSIQPGAAATLCVNTAEDRTALLQVGTADDQRPLIWVVPTQVPLHLRRCADKSLSVIPMSEHAAAIMSFLHAGDGLSAWIVAEKAAPTAFETLERALAVGYVLLRKRDKQLAEWAERLLEHYPETADSHIIAGWAAMYGTNDVALAIARLLTACDSSLPLFSKGLRLLDDGLRLLARGRHNQRLDDARDWLLPFLRAAHDTMLTSFAGNTPALREDADAAPPSHARRLQITQKGVFLPEPKAHAAPWKAAQQETTDDDLAAARTTVPPSTPLPECYFYLSYPQSAYSGANHWENEFFKELEAEVRVQASVDRTMEIGHFTDMATGSGREDDVLQALGRARVIVPLYSQAFLDGENTAMELATFNKRMASSDDYSVQHIQAVMWAPVGPDPSLLNMDRAMELGSEFQEYGDLGMAAMMRHGAYRPHYDVVIKRLAARIVSTAERTDLNLKPITGIVAGAQRSSGDPSFVVGVIAPTDRSLPKGRDRQCYGSDSRSWRPFHTSMQHSIADITVRKAQGQQLQARVVDFMADDVTLDSSPGIILVDPWILAEEKGKTVLETAFAEMRNWATLLVVTDKTDPQYTERVQDLASQVIAMKSTDDSALSIEYADEFDRRIGKLIATARRRYLHAQILEPSSRRPRLRDEPVPA